ncbi:MAG: M14 family metallopeptidase [Acidobacteriota bacterium]|nr:M14 family metallopeptidase [Acidobacteriota bacterium]
MRRAPALFIVLAAATLSAQSAITSPKDAFGFNLGDDYQLASYTQISEYWRRLDAESDRVALRGMGTTAEGRTQLMAVVTSPANHAALEKYRRISLRLGFGDDMTEAEARALAREGKSIVWIDGGLHATETLGAQQLAEMVYQMASRSDAETLRFLDETIVLFVHANPDGNDLVANWYMRAADPLERSLSGLPRLYQKYIGHDNNRDFFMSTQPETENISRALYHEWMPQVLYNHHQSGPAGTVLWSSPQRDPYNYNLDPLVVLGLQALGTHMHQRLASEGKPGATMASGGAYDGWWNGGIRNTANFHNILAILTETIGSPTPMRIPLVVARQLPSRDSPNPIAPQEWRFRQSVDYSISLNRAVIDYAARNREHLLFNVHRMARNAIERGSRDTWTPSPSRFQEAAGRLGANSPELWAAMHRPEDKDPYGYVIPASQTDFPTAVKFINALREVNVAVLRATGAFTVAGRVYPAGSLVVRTAQPFRPHVIDMFEPQDHPNVFPVPGGPPTPPYDVAGWTLAYQMGVAFDRVLEPFDGPFEAVTDWNIVPPPGAIRPLSVSTVRASGLTARPGQNDGARAINRFLAAGDTVRRLPDGSLYVALAAGTRDRALTMTRELGVSFAESVEPSPLPPAIAAPRIGLWDQYGGSMPSGWTRWILEQFEFPFERVFAPALDAGNLRAKYDVLIFVSGAIGAADRPAAGGRGGAPPVIPAEYRDQAGTLTQARTLPQIEAFIRAGGTVIAIGSSAANLARFLGLPISDHLSENGQPFGRAKFFVPGSVLSARVATAHPIARGLPERVDVFFDESPVFRLVNGSAGRPAHAVTPLVWFDGPAPLRSGWAWGQQHLDTGIAALEARVGAGRVVLFGPEILHRAQPHGTFKLLFNTLFLSAGAVR